MGSVFFKKKKETLGTTFKSLWDIKAKDIGTAHSIKP